MKSVNTRLHRGGGRSPVSRKRLRSLDRTPQHATAQQSVRRWGSRKMSQMLVWNPPRYLRRRTGGAAVVDAIGVFSETTTSAIANAIVDSFLLARGVRTGGQERRRERIDQVNHASKTLLIHPHLKESQGAREQQGVREKNVKIVE